MKKILYVRMPRTGSTSLVEYCKSTKDARALGGGQCGFWLPQKLGHSIHKSTNVHPNLVECCRLKLGDEKFSEFITFSSVRNPFSRAVSSWKHWSWQRHGNKLNFEQFCERLKNKDYPSKVAEWHAVSPSDHLFTSSGEMLVDYIVRLENIQEDFEKILAVAGHPKREVQHRNQSAKQSWSTKELRKNEHYSTYYNDNTRKIIGEVYKRDIERFGYEFEEAPEEE